MQNLVTKAAESDSVMYQEKVMSTRDKNLFFKHLKSLIKSTSLPKVMKRNGVASSSLYEKVDFLNDFFQSVYSPKVEFNLSDIKCENPKLTNLILSKTEIFDVSVTLDNKKLRKLNRYSSILIKKTPSHMSNCLNKLLKNVNISNLQERRQKDV